MIVSPWIGCLFLAYGPGSLQRLQGLEGLPAVGWPNIQRGMLEKPHIVFPGGKFFEQLLAQFRFAAVVRSANKSARSLFPDPAAIPHKTCAHIYGGGCTLLTVKLSDTIPLLQFQITFHYKSRLEKASWTRV